MSNFIQLNFHYILWTFQTSLNSIKMIKLSTNPAAVVIVTQYVYVIVTFRLSKSQ